MHTKFRVLHFFLVLIMAVSGGACLIFFELFGHDSAEKAIFLPIQADWAMRVDVEQLAKTEAYTLLFEAKDDQLIDLLENIVDKRVESHRRKGPLTIDFRQDVVLFGMHENDRQLSGILLQVIDPETFLKNIPNHLKKGQSAVVSGNTALILRQTGGHKVAQSEMRELADKYLKNRRKWNAPVHHGMGKSLVVLETKSASGSIDLSLYQKDRAISIKGFFRSSTKSELKPANYTLKSKGLYITTAIIPEGLADSLNRLLPIVNFRIPELRSLTMDYQGLAIVETPSGFGPVPEMNLIMESTKPFSVDSILKTVPSTLIKNRNEIQVGNMIYYLKQLDDKTVFLGLDPNTIIHQKTASICMISGSPKSVGKIDTGKSFTAAAVLDMIPQVRAGREFLAKTKHIDLQVKNQKQNDYSLKGKMEFNDDAYPLHEVVRLLVGLGYIQ